MPVLTAHPTEVRRKSILDTERAIAGLIEAREARICWRQRSNDEELLAAISALWQTRMLRPEKLSVYDEIANALAYWRTTFLREMPAVHAAVESAAQLSHPAPTFLALGSWIGGDRDGHPHVTAATMRAALKAQAETVFDHYAEEVAYASEPNCRCRGADCGQRRSAASCAGRQALTRRAQRADEPYRAGAHRDVCATARHRAATWDSTLHARAAVAPAAPYGAGPSFARRPGDGRSVAAGATAASGIARLRVAPLLPRDSMSSVFMVPRSTCARVRTCIEAVVAELMTRRSRSAPTTASSPKSSVCACWRANSRIASPLVSAHLHYTAARRTNSMCFMRRVTCAMRFGAARDRPATSSRTQNRCRICSRWRCYRRSRGLLLRHRVAQLQADGGAALRDDRRSRTGARHHAASYGHIRGCAVCCSRRR